MKIRKIILPMIALGLFSISSAFSDLPTVHWGYANIHKMVEEGLVSGYTDGTFKPDKDITREEFATLVSKTLNLKPSSEATKFADIEDGRWSKQYIDSVSDYMSSRFKQYKFYFDPMSSAVREEVATTIVKALGLENETVDYSLLDRFSDKNSISEDAKQYVAIAVEKGLLSGNSNGTFNPQGHLTRAQVCAVINNIRNYNGYIEHKHSIVVSYKINDVKTHTEYSKCELCGMSISEDVVEHKYKNKKCACGQELYDIPKFDLEIESSYEGLEASIDLGKNYDKYLYSYRLTDNHKQTRNNYEQIVWYTPTARRIVYTEYYAKDGDVFNGNYVYIKHKDAPDDRVQILHITCGGREAYLADGGYHDGCECDDDHEHYWIENRVIIYNKETYEHFCTCAYYMNSDDDCSATSGCKIDDLEYTEINDNYHRINCGNCNMINEKQRHTYVDGECKCGARK